VLDYGCPKKKKACKEHDPKKEKERERERKR